MQLTLSQVVELFSVSENTVTRWVKEGNLPVHDINSQYRFDRSELLEWAVTNQHPFSPMIFQKTNGDHVAEVSLADAIERGGVAFHVGGQNRYEVFRAAISDLPMPDSFDRSGLLDLIMSREKSGGTALGHGIAIPHPRYPVVLPGSEAVVRVCYLEQPLDCGADDGEPITTLILMICPTVHSHLQLLSRMACLLNKDDVGELLRAQPDKTRLVSAVRAEELGFAEGHEMP